MCGIIAGDGYASQGRYHGIAVKSKLIVAKILDERGAGKLYDFIRAIKWILELKKYYDVRILNLSIELDQSLHYRKDDFALLQYYLTLLCSQNMILVAAAGNRNPKKMGIAKMQLQDMISVDRMNSKEKIAFADIYAPGDDIISCSVSGDYTSKTGTSMAAPMVTGACALCLQKYPKMTNIEIKNKIIESSCKIEYNYRQSKMNVLDIASMLEV